MATLEDTVRPMSTDVQVIKKKLSEHTLKMADMEDRMGRNIRLMNGHIVSQVELHRREQSPDP